MIEYVLLLALLFLACIVGVRNVGQNTYDNFHGEEFTDAFDGALGT